MTTQDEPMSQLRAKLTLALGDGMRTDPLGHAEQVAEVVSVLRGAFASAGFDVTLVGGAAVEVHAPGIYRSGDLDVVVEKAREDAERRDDVFLRLGFRREGRHWRFGDALFVELVPGPVAGPTEEVRLGSSEFRVVTKEVVLRDRLVGFKQWKHTAYGQQAIDMLAAFGDTLDMAWLEPELQREGSLDALYALRQLADSDTPVTEALLRQVIDELHQGGLSQ